MRDDFAAETIRRLGERVGLLCSNPACRAPTKGPHTSAAKATNVGNAAHIHAAAAGGPRYDSMQTEDQRSSIENGIWLCSMCSTLVDADPARFPATLLRLWKAQAEHDAEQRLGKPSTATPVGRGISVELTLDYKKKVIQQELHCYELAALVKNVGTKRIDDWYIEVEFPTLLVQQPGTVIGTKVDARSNPRISLFRTPIGNTPNLNARKPLLPGDVYDYGLPYRIDRALYYRNLDENLDLFEDIAKARVYLDGELAVEVARPVGELQCY